MDREIASVEDRPGSSDDRSPNSGRGSGSDDDDRDDDDDVSNGGSDISGSGKDDEDEDDDKDSHHDHDDDDVSSGHSGSGNSGSGSDHQGRGEHRSSRVAATESHGGNVRDARIEHDEGGEERLSGEVLLAGAEADIRAANRAGYETIARAPLQSLHRVAVRLNVPEGMEVPAALTALRRLAPRAIVTANSVYRNSEAQIRAAPSSNTTPRAPALRRGAIGIIDTGVDAASLQPGAVLGQVAFAGHAPTPREHGSSVAALAVERGVRVHVADVFATARDGSVYASTDGVAAALDWMIEHNIPVINISIEGPPNEMLAALVRRASERGHIVVAAAGNGGPLARPAFPAAFDGSVAVTAIDENDRPYLRANRGSYIAFAAPGVNVNVRRAQGDLIVSGTSFAAPVVAAHIAARLTRPSPTRAAEVLRGLQREAIDLGAPGRDTIYGWGKIRDR